VNQATAKARQETKPAGGGDLAVIIQSGSTNTRGYNILIHNDGSATATTIGATDSLGVMREFPPGTIDTTKLRNLLTKIGDVSRIPIGSCIKSASFGTTTRISYAGKVSGDLQCIQQQASGGDQALLQESRDLGKLVQTTLSQLKINAWRVNPTQ